MFLNNSIDIKADQCMLNIVFKKVNVCIFRMNQTYLRLNGTVGSLG